MMRSMRGANGSAFLIVDIFLRPSEQMDDARGCDGDEHETRQMMRADEDRVDMQGQRQRQHGVHRARCERDDDVAEAHRRGQRDQDDEDPGNEDGDDERAQRRIDVAEQGFRLHPREARADQRADPDQRDGSHPGRQATLDQSNTVQHAGADHGAEHPACRKLYQPQQQRHGHRSSSDTPPEAAINSVSSSGEAIAVVKLSGDAGAMPISASSSGSAAVRMITRMVCTTAIAGTFAPFSRASRMICDSAPGLPARKAEVRSQPWKRCRYRLLPNVEQNVASANSAMVTG